MFIKRLRALAGVTLLLIGTISIALPQQVYADPDCSAGKTLTIVAHPDDDLLFVNPKIQQDIDAGKCVETLFVTGGAAASDTTLMDKREAGIAAAYAYMAGETTVEAAQAISIDGHAAIYHEVTNKPKVSVVFLRIVDTTNALALLWNGTSSSVGTVDSSSTYTKQGLIDALHARMASYKPDTIRTLNSSREIRGPGADAHEDHPDHTATAYFAQAAHQNYTMPHEFIGYVGYEALDMLDNVSSGDLPAKQNAFF